MPSADTMQPIFAALNPVLTPWELAYWCAQSHSCLDGQGPASALDSNPNQVLRAACVERFSLQQTNRVQSFLFLYTLDTKCALAYIHCTPISAHSIPQLLESTL